jgi:hypothetical protein
MLRGGIYVKYADGLYLSNNIRLINTRNISA